MLKERYCDMFDKIKADEQLIADTLWAAKGGRKKITVKWMGVAAAACAVCMIGGLPVLAEHVPAVQEMLSRVAPDIVERWFSDEPAMACEDQGIRMEITDIAAQENGAEITFTMQDLEGDRLHQDMSFCDGAGLSLAQFDQESPSISSCKMIGYDAESRKLTMLYTVEFGSGHTMVPGDLLTLSVNTLMGGRKEWYGLLPEADLAGSLSDEVWEDEKLRIFSVGKTPEFDPEVDTDMELEMLEPTMEQMLAEDVALTAVGYIDGLLHIQLRYDARSMDHYGMILLQKASGESLGEIGSIEACLTDEPNRTAAYSETVDRVYTDYVFDVSEAELAEWSLYGSFSKYTEKLEGNWSVTFNMPEQDE